MSAAPFMSRLERQVERAEQPRKRAKTIPNKTFAERQREAMEMVQSGAWVGAKPVHFVALYAMGHSKAYGVEALELTSSARMVAAAWAARLLHEQFSDDARALYEFVRWTWCREREREAWRNANGRETRRISWRLQFGPHLLADYRLHQRRVAGR